MKKNRIAVDIGGTFTDVMLEIESSSKSLVTAKVPTTPNDPVEGAIKAIRSVLSQSGLTGDQISLCIHGTTLATNTLIEKKGATVGVIFTYGFRDILEIGYERRYNQEDLFIDKPDLLVTRDRCTTVCERISATGDILLPLDESDVEKSLRAFDKTGVESVAVCLLHAYANSRHEQRIAEIIQQLSPHLSVSLSSAVSPAVREFDRACTTVANAYVRPMMNGYLGRFEQALKQIGINAPFFLMTSSGGMTTLETARQFPIRLVESGPSGGAILACRVAEQLNLEQVVSFDMGGTTAKFCLIDNAQALTARDFEIARAERFIKGSGIPVRVPVIDMIEIGAGGGSVAAIDSLQRISIGPESMGADPGPACFGSGGITATVTDADAVLGHIDTTQFAEGRMNIDATAAQTAIAKDIGTLMSVQTQDAAFAVSQMVNENMASAGRVHAAERGVNLAARTMVAFGGNGPLHATRLARKMGISKIIVPPNPGVGSAVGFLYAPMSYVLVASFYTTLDNFDFDGVNNVIDKMVNEATATIRAGDAHAAIHATRSAHMRYAGQGHEIEVTLPNRKLKPDDLALLTATYEREYCRQFKRIVPDMRIEIMNWEITLQTNAPKATRVSPRNNEKCLSADTFYDIYYGDKLGTIQSGVYKRDCLKPGDKIVGPALIVEAQTSTLVEPGFFAKVDNAGNLVLTYLPKDSVPPKINSSQNALDYQLMWNRLLAVVEEQAQALIRCAFSPIVRECGDISAGVFDATGRMMAQAVTGTPGHINTMADGVRHFIAAFPPDDMQPGDIYVTNDPWLAAGHLNDFMLVQPVFNHGKVIAYTACTSHLVDVGGLCMGPNGSDIYDEGILIPPSRMVINGEINHSLMAIIKANSRRPVENEGDLYALIACCEVGVDRLQSMLDEFSITSVSGLSDYIITASHNASIAAISKLPKGNFQHQIVLDGYDFEIEVKANLTITEEELILDFDGSSMCSKFGINVPLNYATAYAVFALRCVVGSDIPNNAGSLLPFKVQAPANCIVNALHPAPVAMRHTIGQLLPDLVLGCLYQALPDKVPAEGASCMYDIPIRSLSSTEKSEFAIELVHNGGTGARPNKDGLSATAYPSGVWGSQVEVTECTVPIRILRRELSQDSGGPGQYRGGLGQVIELESTENEPFMLFLSLDRIKNPARGRAHGKAGDAGQVSLQCGRILPGRGEELIAAGEKLLFSTPGGGGYGSALHRDVEKVCEDVAQNLVSSQAAAEHYGVILNNEGNVELQATLNLRNQHSQRQGHS